MQTRITCRAGRGLLKHAFIAVLVMAPLALSAQSSLVELQHYVQRSLAPWQTPGVSLALVKDGKVLLSRGFGTRSVEDTGPVDEDTLFGIGSCSKAFGSATVAALVGDGKAGWDTRVREYLPQLQLWDPWVTEHITVRDMLSHRSGTSLDDEARGMPTIRRADEWVTRLRYAKPVADFRERYVYSNAMYVAAALMVEGLTSRDWNDFAAERLWRPLHMIRTNGSLEKTLADPNHAAPNFIVGDRLVTSDVKFFVPGTIPATGNVSSTAHDMARWLLFHLNEGVVDGVTVLPTKAVRETHLAQIPIRGGAQEAAYYFARIDNATLQSRDWAYGMGWFINDYRDRRLVWHGGTVPGYRCTVGFMPQMGIGVYVGANRTSLLPVALFFRAMDTLLGAPAKDWSTLLQEETRYQDVQDLAARRRQEAARVAGTHPSLSLADYQGAYASRSLGTVSVALDEGRLRLGFGLRAGQLSHWHYDTFQVGWDQPEFGDTPLATFQMNAAGRVSRLEIAGVGTFEREMAEVP